MCFDRETAVILISCVIPFLSGSRKKALIRINTGSCRKPGCAGGCFFYIKFIGSIRYSDHNRIESTLRNFDRSVQVDRVDSGQWLCVINRFCIGGCSAGRIRSILQICVDLNLKISIVLWNCSNDFTEFFVFSISGSCLENIGYIVTIIDGVARESDSSGSGTVVKIIIWISRGGHCCIGDQIGDGFIFIGKIKITVLSPVFAITVFDDPGTIIIHTGS